MKKNITSMVLVFIIIGSLFLTACGGNEVNNSGENSDEKFDRSDYTLEIATPLSEEDQAIDYTAKSSNPNKVVWRHGSVLRSMDEQPVVRSDRQFFIELKKRLGDKVEIQTFLNGSLGTSADQILGGIQSRNFESYAYNVGAFAEYTKAWMPLDVMFLVPDLEAGDAIVAGKPGEMMNQRCIDDTGLNVLVRGAIGMRHMTNSGKAITSVDGLKGKKIRVQNNPLHILAFKELGASPTPIAYAELFTSLQQKVVDGQENPISNIYDQNYGEIQDSMTLTNHLYTAGAFVVSNDWLLEQDEEFQQAVKESAEIAQAYSGPELAKIEDKLLEKLSNDMDIVELEESEYIKFREISEGTWDRAGEIIGREYLDSIIDAIQEMGY